MTDIAGPGHNSGISAEEAREEMRRALAPWQARRAEFETKAKVAVVDTLDAAKIAIDFVRKARALGEKAEQLRDEVREPYVEALGSVDTIAEEFIESLRSSSRQVSSALKAFNDERAARALALEESQRKAEAELAAKAQEREGLPDPVPEVMPAPLPQRRRKTAPIRTDTGGRMVEHERWRAEVFDPTLVPAMVLKSPRVMEAIRMVAADLMKNGIDVPGVRKAEFTTTTIT